MVSSPSDGATPSDPAGVGPVLGIGVEPVGLGGTDDGGGTDAGADAVGPGLPQAATRSALE